MRSNGNGSGEAITSKGNPNSIRVLMYHRVIEDRDICAKYWTCVHVDDFRRQLEFLDRWGFTAITFEDYRLYQQGKLNLPRRPLIITFDDGYADTELYAYPVMREFGMKGVVFILGDRSINTNYWDRPHGLPTAPLMEADQVIKLHNAGFEIGAHSMSHPKLTLMSDELAWDEIHQSKIQIETLLNSPIRCFSYPYGLVNESIKQMVSAAGYSVACSVFSGPATFAVEHFEIRRIAILNRTSPIGFAARMLTPFHRYEWVRWKAGATLPGLTSRNDRGVVEALQDQLSTTPTYSRMK
jgi:peptidoglycan/xylan/chitin deacetylase (PgdA/CDA1 family)